MILENLMQYKYVFIIAFSLILLIIILLIILKPKKVKPIETTIDDVKEEKTDIEKVIEALEENKEEPQALQEEIEQPVVSDNILEVKEDEPQKETKFKNSEFISPVFGKDNNDKFLKDLKDFRSNL